MPARPTFLRALVFLAVLVAGHALPSATRPLAAQLCAEDPTQCTAPRVTITPASMAWSGTQAVSELSVVIEWCDERALDADSRVVRLDGVAIATGWSLLPRTTGCFSRAESEVTVPVGPGTHTLTAGIQDGDGLTASASAVFTYTYTPPPDTTSSSTHGVAVTPDGGSARRGASEVPAEVFTVRNTGTAAARFRFQGVCAGTGVSGCAAQLDSLALAAGATASVGVTYRAAAAGTAGTVWLKAWKSDAATVRDSGSVAVTVAAATDPGNVLEAGDNTRLDRGACVTAAAFTGAYECGDLRLAHALPETRVLNTPRAPVLLYNSQHARPHPLVAAHFAPPAGAAPAEVSAVLTLQVGSSTRTATRSWPGWAAGETRRIAVGLDAAGVGTGVYDYTLEITARYADGTTRLFPRGGRLVVVDRSASPFGAGWWVAGVEQLFHPADGSKLWVGGDGSTRIYRATGTPNQWAADAHDRPDLLTYDAGTGIYTRALPGGVEVRFNGDGRHVETRNRAGHLSVFEWTGALLTRIHLPRAAAFNTGYAYLFAYNGTPARLASVTAPGPRVVSWRTDPGQRVVMAIGPFAADTVRFAYGDATARVTRRTDRMGAAVDFAYDAAQRLSRATHTMRTAATGDDLVLGFTAAEGLGVAAATPAASVATVVDGPRADVPDRATLFLDRRGAPVRVRDAMGGETTLTRGDPAWPGLVTRVRSPGGGDVSATFDARGNLATTTDNGRAVGGKYPVTSYQWDPRWDAVTQVTLPEGEVTRIAYDSLGRRAWTQTGRSESRRVTFAYHPLTSVSAPGLVESVTEPGGAVTRFEYDARGNLGATVSPLGHRAETLSDVLGRPIRTRVPVEGSVWQTDTVVYDGRGFVQRTESAAPAYNGQGAQRLVVVNAYDPEGRLLTVSRHAVPDSAGAGTVVNGYEYDAAGRKTADVAPDGKRDVYTLDPAGNVRSVLNRLGHTITMEYDTLGRLRKRRVPGVSHAARATRISASGYYTGLIGDQPMAPWFTRDAALANETGGPYEIAADSAVFAYDAAGNLVAADNGDAQVRRVYNADGTLLRETQKIRTVAGLDEGGSFDAHVHTVEYAYDLNGRRTEVRHPAQLSPVAGGKTTFRYDPETGALAEVRDVLGNAYRYRYSARGDLDTLSLPGGITERFRHDADGRLTGHEMLNASLSPEKYPYPILRSDTMTYDARGKMLGVVNPVGTGDRVTIRYSGLGHVLTTRAQSTGIGTVTGVQMQYTTGDTLRHDALGNVYRSASVWQKVRGDGSVESSVDRRAARLFSGTGRLRARESTQQADTTHYDAMGNVVYTTHSWIRMGGAENERVSYYAADGQLRAADFRTAVAGYDETPFRMVFDEYRYDALGRRVWARSRRWCQGVSPQPLEHCRHNTLRRTVWDGDAELYEIQMPGGRFAGDTEGPTPAWILENDTASIPARSVEGGSPSGDPNVFYGRVAYTYGLGIDRPLGVTRIKYADAPPGQGYREWAPFTVVPHWNSRGLPDHGSFDDGGRRLCVPGSGGSARCVQITWPEGWFAYERSKYTPAFWHGTLIEDKRDGAGTMYRRNRSYDPATGRFTQEDPIGIAGGLNLYGFGDGDPVSFSDPYGLCTDPDNPNCRTLAERADASMQQFFAIMAEKAYDLAWDINEAVNPVVNAFRAGFGRDPRTGAEITRVEQLGSGVMVVLSTVGGGGATFEAKAASHVFRRSAGHVNPATASSRRRFVRLFESVANNPANRNDNVVPAMGIAAGKRGFAQTFHGGQVWVHVINGRITDAGVNLPGTYR